MTPRELIRNTSLRFHEAGIPDPVNDSALLLSHLCGKPPLELRLDSDTELNDTVVSAFMQLAGRRLDRIPLQYLTEEAPFCGRIFHVDRRVLIPRPETELLCEWALEVLSGLPAPRVLDLCTGSGCIGLTLKAERPDARVTLSDLSSDALAVAAENARAMNLDVAFHRGDLLNGFSPGSFCLIVCNPPYIPSAECEGLQPEVLAEPCLALDGGTDGLALYRRLIPASLPVLSGAGKLLLEVGSGESGAVENLLSGHGFQSVTVRRDYAGINRMILASKP